MQTKLIKCKVLLNDVVVDRSIIIESEAKERELHSEVAGMLSYMPEFETTKHEVLAGERIQRICEKGE